MAFTYIPTNTINTIVQAADINAILSALQHLAGQTEVGHYLLAGSSYVTNGLISDYRASISRGATPVSVAINTADQAQNGYTANPSTNHLTANGFQVYGFSNGVQANCFVGGAYTITY